MCDFLAGLDMHGFSCWCMVLLLSVAWFCRVMVVVLSLDFPFFECHGVGMFTSVFELWFSWMDLRIHARGGLKFHLQRPRNPLTNFGGILVNPEHGDR